MFSIAGEHGCLRPACGAEGGEPMAAVSAQGTSHRDPGGNVASGAGSPCRSPGSGTRAP